MLDTVAAARVARRDRLKRIADAAVPDSPISFRPQLKNTRPFGVLPQAKRARNVETLRPPQPPQVSYDEVTIMPPIRKPRSADIQRAVCAVFSGVSMTDLLARYRNQYIVRARHISMYLHKKLIGKSLPVIGRLHGGKDHSTAHNAINRIKDRLNDDPATSQKMEMILAWLRNHRFAVPATIKELIGC